MPEKTGNRDAHFPAIEKKYGQPMAFWFEKFSEIADRKYPEQIAYFRENFGFSQSHANALVLYSRGNTSSKRFSTLDQYLAEFDADKKKLTKDIFKVITTKYPKSKVVIAWNKPMVRLEDDYIFGITVHKNYLLLAPWNTDALTVFEDRLVDYEVNKKTFRVPLDWEIDKKLILDMVAFNLKSK